MQVFLCGTALPDDVVVVKLLCSKPISGNHCRSCSTGGCPEAACTKSPINLSILNRAALTTPPNLHTLHNNICFKTHVRTCVKKKSKYSKYLLLVHCIVP